MCGLPKGLSKSIHPVSTPQPLLVTHPGGFWGVAETREAPSFERASPIELVPYSFTAIRQHHGTHYRQSLPTLDLVHKQAVDDTGAIFEVLNRRAFIDSVEVDRRT